jgi:hypothetical protein
MHSGTRIILHGQSGRFSRFYPKPDHCALRAAVGLLTVILLAGCAARTVQVSSTFDAKQAAYINTKGKATINGQAFLRRNDGIVVYAAGSKVFLIPVTAYAEERIAGLYQGKKYVNGLERVKIEAGDNPEYESYMRTTKANGEGRFVFSEVAQGLYFVNTAVGWCVPTQNGCDQQGGNLMDRVSIQGAEKVELILDGK